MREPFDRPTPVESRLHARQLRFRAGVAAVLLALLTLALWAFSPNRPREYEDDLAHFFYGSIGADISGGLPAKLLRVLPRAFPEHLPPGAPRDLRAFGFIQEPGEPLPIGFSRRRQIIELTSLNCATCHTGSVRAAPDAPPRIVPGMPAVTVDLHAFFRFLFDVAADENFTAETIIAALEEADLDGPLDAWIYPFVVDEMREGLLERARRNRRFFAHDYPRFGPGRVNTFDTFKVDQFRDFFREHDIALDPDELYGIADFPSIWNQAPRDGLALHWDGNQTSVRERNFSAAIGAGARPEDMDVDSLLRVEAWLHDLPPPAWPFELDAALAERGAAIYQRLCHDCHDFDGDAIASVVPLDRIGTDPYRNWSYTRAVLEAQQDYTEGYFWSFRNFSVTDGYSSHPLDGIWARAPYLHNGSVPSLWDLLTPEAERPVAFELGVDVYDTERLGFTAARLVPEGDGFRKEDGSPWEGGHFVLDTRLPGNGARGHSGPAYGTTLPETDRRALVEYLKTL